MIHDKKGKGLNLQFFMIYNDQSIWSLKKTMNASVINDKIAKSVTGFSNKFEIDLIDSLK